MIDAIRDLDSGSGLAPRSETSLLGPAIESMTQDATAENLAWWTGAYSMLVWANDNAEAWAVQYGRDVWDSPAEMILASGDDWAGWTPLLAWRLRGPLTQARAATIAGVDLRSWQRWEAGDRAVPQWLADVLAYRWGNGP